MAWELSERARLRLELAAVGRNARATAGSVRKNLSHRISASFPRYRCKPSTKRETPNVLSLSKKLYQFSRRSKIASDERSRGSGMQGRSVRRGLALVAAFAAALVVAVLELAGKDGEPGPISALVLSTRLGPDGQPLPPPPLPPSAGLAICSGPSCGQADPGTQTMMENIKKVLHALDSRLGNMKSAERDWKSTMAHKVRMMSQQVGSLGSEEKKVYFLQQDVKRKLAARGPPGPQGPQGQAGRHGINGGQGPFGAGGPRGIEGVQGKQGPAGIIGAPGIRYACVHFFLRVQLHVYA